MMNGIILNSWKSVKQHIPLIRFRKGGPIRESTPSPAAGSVPSNLKPSASSSKNAHQLPVIEDWQLPQHYRRAMLDEKEIDAINSGGAY